MRTFEGGARWIYNESRRVGLGFVRVEKATLLSTQDQRKTPGNENGRMRETETLEPRPTRNPIAT